MQMKDKRKSQNCQTTGGTGMAIIFKIFIVNIDLSRPLCYNGGDQKRIYKVNLINIDIISGAC